MKTVKFFIYPLFLIVLLSISCETDVEMVEPLTSIEYADNIFDFSSGDIIEVENARSGIELLKEIWTGKIEFTKPRTSEVKEKKPRYMFWYGMFEDLPPDDIIKAVSINIVIDNMTRTIEGIMTCIDEDPSLNRQLRISGNVLDDNADKFILRVYGYHYPVMKRSKIEILDPGNLLDPDFNSSKNTVSFYTWTSD